MKCAEAIRAAADLLRDGSSSEYRRGVLNILAELYAKPEMPIDERMDEIEQDIQSALGTRRDHLRVVDPDEQS